MVSHAAAEEAVEIEAAGAEAGRDITQACTAAEKKQHVCTHCGAQLAVHCPRVLAAGRTAPIVAVHRRREAKLLVNEAAKLLAMTLWRHTVFHSAQRQQHDLLMVGVL